MKNIHVLPTDKPSRLFYNVGGALLFTNYENHNGVNIYITSDEEIKEDYVIAYGVVIKVMIFDKETLYFVNGTKAKREDCKKIILTTDQDLIKDGVQAIDDEFLEWFVENPSCEVVEVVYEPKNFLDASQGWEYTIISKIPKEEPMNMKEQFEKSVNIIDDWLKINGDPEIDKQVEQEAKELCEQETLEELKKRFANDESNKDIGLNYQDGIYYGIEVGAKWQQEQFGKSEFIQKLRATLSDAEARRLIFEQFKNK